MVALHIMGLGHPGPQGHPWYRLHPIHNRWGIKLATIRANLAFPADQLTLNRSQQEIASLHQWMTVDCHNSLWNVRVTPLGGVGSHGYRPWKSKYTGVGKTSLKLYLRQFEMVANFNAWEEAEKAL